MAQVIFAGPLQELELANEHGLQPHALDHLRLGQSLSPTSALRLWKVREWALVDLKALELPEQLRARHGRETVARPRRVDQLVPLVVAEDQRVERLRASRVA